MGEVWTKQERDALDREIVRAKDTLRRAADAGILPKEDADLAAYRKPALGDGEQTAKDIFGYDSPEFRAEGITLKTPKVLGGMCWYWLVAGKQFCCSFRGPKDGLESRRALEALVAYVKRELPEPVPWSVRVVGPCCVPEGGDFPKPIKEDADG